MNAAKPRLIEVALEEALGGVAAPDLTQRALARLAASDRGGEARALQLAQRPEVTAGRSGDAIETRGRVRWIGIALAAASVVAGLVLMLLPGETRHPGLRRAPGAALETTNGNAVRLVAGTVLMTQGAPVLQHDNGRVELRQGRALVKAGEIPNSAEAGAIRVWLDNDGVALTGEETSMILDTQRWFARGAMALCILSGSVVVDGETLRAEDAPARDDAPKAVEAPRFAKLREWTGDDSAITTREYHMISAQADWNALWTRHAPDTAAPDVDFTKNAVIAAFDGKSVNCRSVDFQSVLACDACYEDVYYVRLGHSTFQTAGPGGGAKHVTPFGIFEFPAPDRNIVLEMHSFTSNLKPTAGGKSQWREVARFGAIAGANAPVTVPAVSQKWEGGSEATDDTFALCKTWAEAQPYYKGYVGKDNVPQIDFDKECVLFVNIKGAGWGIEIEGVLATPAAGSRAGQTVVRVAPTPIPPLSDPCTSGYGLYVLPKEIANGTIVIERQIAEDGPGGVTAAKAPWVELHRFTTAAQKWSDGR